ncbi:MAG: hypothetical protein J5771_00055, partial [Bacteroidales bacterium]|nr:hypothetical protein [Bacteroidales bacterium]
AQRDSIARADSLANIPPPDTTKIGFAVGIRNVKIYRKDMQVRCDSLRYTDLDSIARFYLDPVVWNEGRRQYFSDSLNVLIRNNAVERASLMSNAMIVTYEDTLHYDQIKGAEIIAFFDTTAALTRFDAIGGASAIFYLEENGQLSTVNKVESKMLSGNFLDGTLDRMHYFDTPKNDAYPVVQFPKSDQYIKGFKWVPELKPTGKTSITTLTVRQSQRAEYAKHPRAKFKETNIYFPGYMKSVYASIDESHKSHPKKPEPKLDKEIKALDMELEKRDSTAARDTLAVVDSLTLADSLPLKDSLALCDSLVVKDSLTVAPQEPPKKTFKQKFNEWRERNAARRKERAEAREARWAILDARDAAKAEEKAKKDEAKARAKKQKELDAAEAEAKKDQEILNKYIEYYKQKKEKEKNGKH